MRGDMELYRDPVVDTVAVAQAEPLEDDSVVTVAAPVAEVVALPKEEKVDKELAVAAPAVPETQPVTDAEGETEDVAQEEGVGEGDSVIVSVTVSRTVPETEAEADKLVVRVEEPVALPQLLEVMVEVPEPPRAAPATVRDRVPVAEGE